MSLRYSYQLHNAHQHPLHAHPLQELQEAEVEEAEAEEAGEAEAEEAEEAEAEVEEAEEVEAEEDKQTPLPCLASDSAETLLKYLQEKERKQTASSPNSNATIWPTSESQNLTPGSERSSSLVPTSKAPLSINGSTEQWTGSCDWIL